MSRTASSMTISHAKRRYQIPINLSFNSTQVVAALSHLDTSHLIISAESNLPRKEPRNNIPLLQHLIQDLHSPKLESALIPTLKRIIYIDNSSGRVDASQYKSLTPYTSITSDLKADANPLLKTSPQTKSSTSNSHPAQPQCPKQPVSPTVPSSTTAPRSGTECVSHPKTSSAAHHHSSTASAASWATWPQQPTAQPSSSPQNPSTRAQHYTPYRKNTAQPSTACRRCSSSNLPSLQMAKSPPRDSSICAPGSQRVVVFHPN